MIIQELGLIFIMAAVLTVVFKALKQPTIPAYVLSGIVIGPMVLRWISHPETITELSEIAAVLMLFVIGIEMDLFKLRKVGLVAIAGGILQVSTTFGVGYLIAKLLHQTTVVAIYMGLGLSFSSTMLVVKSLGEKNDLNSLYGRVTVGILIMQDMLAIFALSSVSTIDNFSPNILLTTTTSAAGLILIVVVLIGRFVLPRLFEYASREREVLFVVVMGVLFITGIYAEKQHLSMGIGSFLAGLAVSNLSYRHEISGDLKALKSFFTIVFFAALGLQLAPQSLFADLEANTLANRLAAFGQTLLTYWPLIVAFLLAALFIKPLISMITVSLFGYQKSTSFDTGLALGQISEFSLFIAAQGITYKHLNSDLLTVFIIITVLSMTVSSYVMKFNHSIYERIGNSISWLEMLALGRNKITQEAEVVEKDGFEVLLVGRHRMGRLIEQALRERKAKYVVVDMDPDVMAELRKDGVPFIYGDICNVDVLKRLNFESIMTVFCAIPSRHDIEQLINHVKRINPSVKVIPIVDSKTEAQELYKLGADYVLITYELAAEQLLTSHGELRPNLNALITAEKAQLVEHASRHRKHIESGLVIERIKSFEKPANTATLS